MQTTEPRIEPGWDVYGSDGQKVGSVQDVGPNYLVVEKGLIFVSDLYIPVSAVESLDEDRHSAYLNIAKGDVDGQGWNEPPAETDGEWEGWSALREHRGATSQAGDPMTGETGDTARVPVVEERLRATKSDQQIGQVDVRKNVREEEQTLDVPVTREDVSIRRTPVDRPVGSGETAFESRSITVPVRGESVELEKDAHVVEEVEVSKTPRTEHRQVSGTVRREDVDIDTTGDASVRGGTDRTSAIDRSSSSGRELSRDPGDVDGRGREHGTEAVGGAAGAVGGAVIGGAVGGPPGAVIGGAVGAAGGAIGGEAAEGNEKAGSGVGGAAGAVGGAAVGGAIAGPPGAIVGGAVGAGGGAGAGDKAEESAEDH